MRDFKPTYYLIGSSAEATRLGHASEIDVTNKLEGLVKEFFTVTGRLLTLTSSGKDFFGNLCYDSAKQGRLFFNRRPKCR